MIKRFFDILLAAIGAILLSPAIAVIALSVLGASGRPIIFAQSRPGLNGKPFRLYKFRTMADRVDSNGNLLSDGVRLTKFGRFLRSTSLDELPELFNVLRGDMSLVGPRPLLTEYLPLYSSMQARRHEVRPGITGWAQINGRNSLTWDERFELDVWYVENQSFLLDIRIIFITLAKVLKRENISHPGDDTMPKFTGRPN